MTPRRLLLCVLAALTVTPSIAQLANPRAHKMRLMDANAVKVQDQCIQVGNKTMPADCKLDPAKSLTARTIIGDTSRLHRLDFPAGVKSPHHSHADEEMFYILTGKFRVVAGDQVFELEPGDVLKVPAFVDHEFEALVDSSLLEFGGPGPMLSQISATEKMGE